MKILKDYLDYDENPLMAIEEYKEKLLDLILFLVNVLAIPALISALAEYLMFGKNIAGFLYIILFCPVFIALIFKKRFQFKQIVFLILFSGFMIGSLTIYNEGFFGVGIPLYITIIVLSTLLLGIKESLILMAICFVTLILASILFTKNVLIVSEEIKNSSKEPVSWVAIIVSFLYLGGLIAFSVARINKKLVANISYNENQAKQLLVANNELSNISNQLESQVLNRTSEIVEKTNLLVESNKILIKKNKELEDFNRLFIDREFRIKELKDKVTELENKLKNL
jgi:hypothetical protein